MKLYDILFERATDTVYHAFTNYVQNVVINNLSDPQYEKPEFQDEFPYFRLKPKLESLSYEDYKKSTGDTGSIIRNEEDFKKIFSEFTIEIWPKEKRPDAGGDMNNNGTMRVFLKDWLFTPGQSALSNDQIAQFPSRIKEYFSEHSFKNLLAHELGHYVNAIRSSHRDGNRKEWRDQSKKRNKAMYASNYTDTPEYINSTEEIQARIADFNSYLSRILNGQIEDSSELLTTLHDNDVRNFIKVALNTEPLSIMNSNSLTNDNYKRVTNRLVDIFNRLRKNPQFQKSETEIL